MNNHTITTGKGFPAKAVTIALALTVVLVILAMQGMALVTAPTSHPVVVQQGSSDLGSRWTKDSACGIKSSRTPPRCFSGSARREDTGGLSRPTLRQIQAHKS